MTPFHLLSAIELRDAFVRGDVSAVRIAEHFLHRIEIYDPHIKAFLAVFGPRVLGKAEALDRKRAHGKAVGVLAAVPVVLKDNMHLEGEFTTCASKFLSNYRAPFSATAVRLLEAEDALILGKTNLDEFAMGSSTENSAYFPTRNPWNLATVPGGSSGGSAAAVSARLALMGTGSDTGGSIRQPAAFSGLVGYKPTYGRVSRYGLVAFGSSLDQIGPLTTNVSDAALMMEVIGRHCPHDATSLDLPPETYRDGFTTHCKDLVVGIPWHFLEQLPDASKKNFLSAVETLRSLGTTLVDVDLNLLRYSTAVYYILATAEASTNLARFDGIRYGQRASCSSLEDIYDLSRAEGFGPEVKQRIMLGTYVLSAGYQDAFYKKAQKVRTLILDTFETAFEQCDLVALPTTPTSAFPLYSIHDPLEMYLQDIFTIPANLAGMPAVSVPSGFDEQRKPLGLQLIGPQMHDVAVLQAAYAYEQAHSWSRELPPLLLKESPP